MTPTAWRAQALVDDLTEATKHLEFCRRCGKRDEDNASHMAKFRDDHAAHYFQPDDDKLTALLRNSVPTILAALRRLAEKTLVAEGEEKAMVALLIAAWAADDCLGQDACKRAADMITTLSASNGALVAALEGIASQKLTSEMDEEMSADADFEGAYDIIIDQARAALVADLIEAQATAIVEAERERDEAKAAVADMAARIIELESEVSDRA